MSLRSKQLSLPLKHSGVALPLVDRYVFLPTAVSPPAFKWLPLPPQYLYFLHKGNSSPAGGAQDSAAAAVALLAEWDACERFPSMNFYLVRRADAR